MGAISEYPHVLSDLFYSGDSAEPKDLKLSHGSFIANLASLRSLKPKEINRIQMATTAMLVLGAKQDHIFTEQEIINSALDLGTEFYPETHLGNGPHMGVTMKEYASWYAERIVETVKERLS